MGFQESDEKPKERVRVHGLGDIPIATQKMGVGLMERMEEVDQLDRIIEAIRDKKEKEKKEDRGQQEGFRFSATSNICRAKGLKGEFKYQRTRNGTLGRPDFMRKGRNLGLTSIRRNPEAVNKSERPESVKIWRWV